jgi:MFS family permease
MKNLIRLEEIALFGLSIFLFSLLNYSWWWFPLLLLLPDIGMIGYVFNSKVGAYVYNFVHHRGVAVVLYIVGALITQPLLQLIGIILFAHSTIDRVFNFGLKYADNFKHTHLT